MVKEAEELGLPLKEYLKLLDKEAKRNAQSNLLKRASVDHYV
jgi:hypothetical protein